MPGGFLRGGMRPPPAKGRESFLKKSSSPTPMGPPPHMASPHTGADAGETRIVHHPSGEHEVHHSDGEVSKHPNAGHMAAHLHAKHAGGEAGNMHHDGMGGPVTTHHAGADGEVSGPVEHASPQEGADHLAGMMSGGGMENEGNEPDGDEYPAVAE